MRSWNLIAFAAALLAILSSCGKEPVYSDTQEPEETWEEYHFINPIDGYYATWSDIVSNILKHCKESELEIIMNANLPETGALSGLDIRDAENRKINFAELTTDEQLDFIRAAALTMAKEQHRKADIARDVTNLFSFQKEIVDVCRKAVESLMASGANIADILEVFAPSNGWPDFFGGTDTVNPDTKSGIRIEIPVVFGPKRPDYFSFDVLKSQMAGVGKKGMILVQTPIHGYPNTLYNLSNYLLPTEEMLRTHRALGHACILTEDFLSTTGPDADIIYGVDNNGTMFEDMSCWYTPFYLMELKRLKFIWAPELDKDNPLTLVKVPIPESEINSFVEDELSLIGSPFVGFANVLDFTLSKYRMPEHGFTCVGLIWYCSKRTLNIDISFPAMPTIMPVNAICSPFTDIIATIQ